MKHLVLLTVLLFPIVGCCPERVAAPALKNAWKVLGAEYVAYVEGDANLSPETKATRKRTAEEFGKTLEALK